MSILATSFFIVWRECLEALLVCFVLWMALKRAGFWTISRTFIFSGVALGSLLSGVLALLLLQSQNLNSNLSEWAQALFPILGSLLMLQMVIWMKKHSQDVVGEIHRKVSSGEKFSLTWGLMLLVTYTFAREGFETVIYLYGLSFNPQASFTALNLSLIGLLGFLAAALILFFMAQGLRFIKVGRFFQFTNLILLMTSASLLVMGTNQLIAMEVLPPLLDPVWNTSEWLGAEGFWGQILSVLAGYTPTPSLTGVLVYVTYWLLALALLLRSPKPIKETVQT